MSIQLIMEFQLQQGEIDVGWSEELHFPGSSLTPSTIAPIQAVQNSYIATRLQLFGAGVINTVNRLTVFQEGIAIVGPQRHPSVEFPGFVPQFLIVSGQQVGLPYYNSIFNISPADFSQSVQLVRWYTDPAANPQYVRNVWYSGLPDFSQNTNQQGQSSADIRRILNTISGGLAGWNVQIRSIDRSTANPFISCTAIDSTGLIYAANTSSLTTGQLIKAVGFRAASGGTVPRGTYRVTVISGTELSLQNAKPAAGVTTIGGFRAVKYVINPVRLMTIENVTNRKRGRPFELLRGRRLVSRTSRS